MPRRRFPAGPCRLMGLWSTACNAVYFGNPPCLRTVSLHRAEFLWWQAWSHNPTFRIREWCEEPR